jgi:pSer/pThr/pTyr-binding forkhead associated (FHA) protein
MQSRILLGALLGTAGGFIGFVLQEEFTSHSQIGPNPFRDLVLFGLFVGLPIGMAVGLLDGIVTGSTNRMWHGLALGGIVGAIGGVFGVMAGEKIYDTLLMGQTAPALVQNMGIFGFLLVVIARALGWALLGALPGLAAGASTRSYKRARNGFIGGLIGGFLGGLIFDMVAELLTAPLQGAIASSATQRTQEIGGPSRAIGITAIGLFTGLFIGLAEELFKSAWVISLAGNHEGRQYILTKDITIIGRDERADIPIFVDRQLMPQHTAIKAEQGRHYLVDGGAPPVPLVNGQAVQNQMLLKDGDMLQIGQARLMFHEKATAKKYVPPPMDVSKNSHASTLNIPANYCPFCGAPKDSAGHCQCDIPAQTPMPLPDMHAFAVQNSAPMPLNLPKTGAILTGIGGPVNGVTFPLQGDNITIGRSPSNQVALALDSAVSRSHAHIALENGEYVLYDDNSSNGTFVNNMRITRQTLNKGDVIQVGGSQFRLD